jgi:hypothetical protein
MVDGVFTRRTQGSIRPIELGRRLVREMDDHRSVDVKGRRIVPNDFTIVLSPADRDGFGDIEVTLTTELAEAAKEYAREEGYHFMGPVSVVLRVENSLKPGRFGIASQLRQSPGGSPLGALVLPSGERIELRDKPLTIGRLSDSNLTLPDHNVSRRHAEVRRSGNGFSVVDLGSTNGTMINGVRISGEHRLQDGDIVSIGSTHVRFEAS